MDRRHFLQICGVLGIGTAVAGCAGTGQVADSAAPVDGAEVDGAERSDAAPSVLIIGAGAAGMSAAYLLSQQGVSFRVLEAAPIHGGRIKRSTDFVDFPIPLGAEWLHDDPETLEEIVNDDEVDINTRLAAYGPGDTVGYFDGELTIDALEDADLKFVGSTWLDFFDAYVVPSIADRMVFDTQIVAIDHVDGVVLTDAAGAQHTADAVIVTVPLSVLRDSEIDFTPALPSAKIEAIDSVEVWGGIKVFIEFDEPFFPTFVEFPDSATDTGQRLYYDASYAQDTEASVLGLFAVGAQAERYQVLKGDELLAYVLDELDVIFDGAASRHYVQHIVQDWSEEPFINQAYVADVADWRVVAMLGEPVGDHLFFAGEGYTDGEDWGSVHVAATSARAAVGQLLDRL